MPIVVFPHWAYRFVLPLTPFLSLRHAEGWPQRRCDHAGARCRLRYLNVRTVDETVAIVARDFDTSQPVQHTRLILEELLPTS